MLEDNGNKCGKCQNHEYDVLKKGHARDCQFKNCVCSKCRLLDARSDILQVISGKETKLKGTKKDPNCGFCQNHGRMVLRKGHVRSCGFGQERHFKSDNCFDCEVHYIRNEVNRLQIKMRRAMKEDKSMTEEARKTAREAITCAEVEKVCDMARLARKKREIILRQQQNGDAASAGTSSSTSFAGATATSIAAATSTANKPTKTGGSSANRVPKQEKLDPNLGTIALHHHHQQLPAHNNSSTNDHQHLRQLRPRHKHNHHLTQSYQRQLLDADQLASVWRPWSQQQQQVLAIDHIHHHDRAGDQSLLAEAVSFEHHRQQHFSRDREQHQQQQQQEANSMMLQYAAAAVAAANSNLVDLTTSNCHNNISGLNLSPSSPSPTLVVQAPTPPDFGGLISNLIVNSNQSIINSPPMMIANSSSSSNNNSDIRQPLQDEAFSNILRLLIQLSQQQQTTTN